MAVHDDMHVSLFDLVTSLSDLVDLIDLQISNHHKKVAYISHALALEMGLGREAADELLLAGLLHDIGVISHGERIRTLQFEVINPHVHAELGSLLLKPFPPLAGIAKLIRHHHACWSDRKNPWKEEAPLGSHILHLADRVAILAVTPRDFVGNSETIRRRMENQRGGMFMPEVVDAFLRLSRKDYFWLDLASPALDALLRRLPAKEELPLDLPALLDLADVFARSIDFRSRFTATHSSGVAAVAEALAELTGFSERDCRLMRVSGLLHDLGKLAVPTEILEKPHPLTPQERNVIRCHSFYTYRTLEAIPDFGLIRDWGALHHERLDGVGYPFHLGGGQLSLGSRIVGVADVFTAITEDRPYRAGMGSEQALAVLEEMVRDGALDKGVVDLLVSNYDRFNAIRESAQTRSSNDYNQVQEELVKAA